MSKFVLAALGTYGDVNPYIAVALGLKERGHQVLVATSSSHRQKVESEGLPFHALRPDLFHVMNSSPEIAARGNDLRTGTEYILKTLVLPVLRQTFDDLRDACVGADLMVIHSVLFAAPLVAEKLGLKWTSIILSPGIFLSVFDPPLLPPVAWFHASRHFGAWPHRMLFRWVDRVTRQWMLPVDELRKQVHLPFSPKNPVRDGMISPSGTLGWFSPLMGAPQADWPAKTEVTGFIFYDKAVAGPPDRELGKFLEQGDPPVVFTLGTSASTVAGDFYRASVEAARRGKWRAIFVTGADPRNRIPAESLPASMFVTDYAAYSELFPRAAAVVHPGGIGTVAQALRAGVPMIIVPHAADQPDNAFRAARLGVARVIPRGKYDASRAWKELGTLLENPRYSSRSKTLAAKVRAEDGLARACDILERHAAG